MPVTFRLARVGEARAVIDSERVAARMPGTLLLQIPVFLAQGADDVIISPR